MPGDYEAKMDGWARRIDQVASEPFSQSVKGEIKNRLHHSARERMVKGRGPDGRTFPALSKAYRDRKKRASVAQTFWQGPSRRGHQGGQAIQRLQEFIHTDHITQIINVPYSKAVHDGATFTVKARTSSSIEGRRQFEKGMAKRKTARNRQLKKLYGKRTAAQNRRAHAASLREAAVARKRGTAELLPRFRVGEERRQRISMGVRAAAAVKAGRASRFTPRPKTSWTVRIPARPILGIDHDDAMYIKAKLLDDLHRRLTLGGRR